MRLPNFSFVSYITDRQIVLAILGYTSIYYLARYFLLNGMPVDELEMAVMAQAALLPEHYLRQPPIYAWVQWSFFELFGVNRFAILSLKWLLLTSFYLCLHQACRLILPTQPQRILGLAGTLAIYYVAWNLPESTHTLLLCLALVCTLLAITRIHRTPTAYNYIMLGAAVALGCMAKYNYVTFLLPIVIAAYCIHDFRRVLLHRYMLFSVGVAALCLVPLCMWLLHHPALGASDITGNILHNSEASTPIVSALVTTGMALLLFPLPFLLMHLAFFTRSSAVAKAQNQPPYRLLLGYTIVGSIAFICVIALLFDASAMKSRWMQPQLLFLPLFLASFPLTPVRLRRVTGIFVLFAALITIAVPILRVYDEFSCKKCKPLFPVEEAKAALTHAGFTHGILLIQRDAHAGFFRLAYPKSLVISLEKNQRLQQLMRRYAHTACVHFTDQRDALTDATHLPLTHRQGVAYDYFFQVGKLREGKCSSTSSL